MYAWTYYKISNYYIVCSSGGLVVVSDSCNISETNILLYINYASVKKYVYHWKYKYS